ncbi:DUF2252 domain-containing protein [Agromyces aureus]|uniref:DUF2252 domain-containing protein n=1 Tax=Agromyces aureus TaxID=453304 RepID=A0A191WI61_9MICO|nr:DUF2252 domain-containing protein [Agromyces aureus]ANJ27946.1 hypothetical protein ATC03_15720 [Agromyces aureus]
MSDRERDRPTTARLDPKSEDFDARRESGRAARAHTPRRSHATWAPTATRPDPVALLEAQAETRDPLLIPLRHARMSVSPFTFYRGAAVIMAADLDAATDSGVVVQLCGDAHLSNFGVFGSAERRLVFDINDFDETLPGPFEWDVKRLVASIEIAARHRGFDDDDRRTARLAAVRGYREQILRSAEVSVLDAWYDTVPVEHVKELVRRAVDDDHLGKKQMKRFESAVAKAFTQDRMKVFSKLVTTEGGRMRIAADPPLIVPVEDIQTIDHEQTEAKMQAALHEYQRTLTTERHPIAEYSYVHMARTVPGVGSVGTRTWVVLLKGRDDADPIFLQAKEAQSSVLERFLGASEYEEHGERVVRGQRVMQASSDIFLGWLRGYPDDSGVQRDFYIRQLKDWKGSIDPEVMVPSGAALYARVCGETLARAHGRSGDRVQLAAYLGTSDVFDESISAFAEAYADQNDLDYRAFMAAIASGRIEATPA